jgi:hypothetical protein
MQSINEMKSSKEREKEAQVRALANTSSSTLKVLSIVTPLTQHRHKDVFKVAKRVSLGPRTPIINGHKWRAFSATRQFLTNDLQEQTGSETHNRKPGLKQV